MEGILLERDAGPLRPRIVHQKEPPKGAFQALVDVVCEQYIRIGSKLDIRLQSGRLMGGFDLFAKHVVQSTRGHFKVGDRAR